MRKLYLPLAFIFATTAWVIWRWFKTELGVTDSIVGYVGSFASTYSLIVAVMEIIDLKKVAIMTKQAADQARNAVLKMIEADEMGKAVELVPYIKSSLSTGDYGRAITNLEKLSISFCEIYHIDVNPEQQQRIYFDRIHTIIDKLEIKHKGKKKLELNEVEEMLAYLSDIQKDLKIESKNRKRS